MLLLSAATVRQIVASFVSLKCFAQAVLPCEMKVARAWKFVVYINPKSGLLSVCSSCQPSTEFLGMDYGLRY
jgi:hypothetical protein